MHEDKIMASAMEKVRLKYLKGVIEHGGMQNSSNGFIDWILELQQEAIDTVFYCEAILQTHDKPAAPISVGNAQGNWQDISTAPKNQTVLIGVYNRNGKWVTAKARYIAEKTEIAIKKRIFGDYDEATDEYYCPEGWYEDVSSETGRDYGYILMSERFTHWMPPQPSSKEGENNE